MKPAAGKASRSAPEEARQAIERFLAASKSPVVVEPGDDPIPIGPANHTLGWVSGYLMLEIWNDQRNLVRRITGITAESRGRLELAIERFGKRAGTITLVDTAAHQDVTRRASRAAYRELLRRSLMRQFLGWRIAELSTEPDLEHSLSPSYPRALVRTGTSAWAAIGAAPGSDVDGVLTFGLIWLDYLRARERRATVEGLAVFLPAGRESTTCLRLRHLNPRVAQFAAFVQTEDGYEDRVDLADYGNVETHLQPATRMLPDASTVIAGWVRQIAVAAPLETVARTDGSVSLRVRGLEVARNIGTSLLFGLETRREATASNLRDIIALVREVDRFRSPGAADRHHPLFARSPEGWLESQVRTNIQEIDATLEPALVYGQVPAFSAGDRDVIDLLGIDHVGRLAILELKASEDIHLPLQSLDYWMRVKWHAARGDFGPAGYFPGVALRQDSPRLLLVAPSLDFHPSNGTVLRYFAPDIEVERIGVGPDWRNSLKVMYRHGARG